MQILGVIPTRMGAVRFPGKPLAVLAGRPLVQWVYEAAAEFTALDRLVVATPDPEIIDAVTAFGGEAVLTSPDHRTGTDRVAEVAKSSSADVVLNLQGDQPFLTAAMLDALVAPFTTNASVASDVVMSTLSAPITSEIDPADSNVVKVVVDRNGDAIYFSRCPIPWCAGSGPAPVGHHLGLYGFTRYFLAVYRALEPTPLERCEGLEQLRALEHGYRIRVVPTDASVIEVNTPEDLAAAIAFVDSGAAQ